MTNDDDLIELLRKHEGGQWRPRPGASEEEIAAAEQALGYRLDEQYRRLLRYSNGGGLYGSEAKIVFLRVAHLTMFNPEMERAPDLAQMFIFGDDQGDFFYYFDRQNLLGRGAWAVFAVEMSVATRDGSIPVARNLTEHVQRVLRGDAVLDAPPLKHAPTT